MKYLIGQKFGGQNCRKLGSVPKILSDEKFCPPKVLSAEFFFSIQKRHFGGQKCRNFGLLPKILSAERFCPPKILSAEFLSDKVTSNSWQPYQDYWLRVIDFWMKFRFEKVCGTKFWSSWKQYSSPIYSIYEKPLESQPYGQDEGATKFVRRTVPEILNFPEFHHLTHFCSNIYQFCPWYLSQTYSIYEKSIENQTFW